MYTKKRLFALVYCTALAALIIWGGWVGVSSFLSFLSEEPRTEYEIIVDTYIKYHVIAQKEGRSLASYKSQIDSEISKFIETSYSVPVETLNKWESDYFYRKKLIHASMGHDD